MNIIGKKDVEKRNEKKKVKKRRKQKKDEKTKKEGTRFHSLFSSK